MSVATSAPKKAFGVMATLEQRRILAEAAKREHRSVSNFVLQAALKAAQSQQLPEPGFTEDEERAIVEEAQLMFRKSSAYDTDLLDKLFIERNADAARG